MSGSLDTSIRVWSAESGVFVGVSLMEFTL